MKQIQDSTLNSFSLLHISQINTEAMLVLTRMGIKWYQNGDIPNSMKILLSFMKMTVHNINCMLLKQGMDR
jgi:hypothetical protein